MIDSILKVHFIQKHFKVLKTIIIALVATEVDVKLSCQILTDFVGDPERHPSLDIPGKSVTIAEQSVTIAPND